MANLEHKIAFLRSGLRTQRNVELDFHSPHKALVETVLARGDCRVGELLQSAFQAGEVFTAWKDSFHFPVWQELLDRHNLGFLCEEFPADTAFPWDFVNFDRGKAALQKDFLLARAQSIAAQPPETATDFVVNASPAASPQSRVQADRDALRVRREGGKSEGPFEKFRIFYEKKGDFRFFSHLSLMQYVERLLRKTGLRFKCSQGFHPRIRLAFLPPLPVGAEGDNEVVECSVQSGHGENELLGALREHGGFFRFLKVTNVSGRPPLSRDIRFVHYRFSPQGGEAALAAIAGLLLPGDQMAMASGQLHLRIDFAQKGPERFARIYRILDPDRARIHQLIRSQIEFKDAP